MIKELNNKSLAFGVPGLLIQTAGLFIDPLVSLIGSVLLIVGLAFYCKAKGHSGWFGLFGIIGIFGLLVLIPLKDRHLTVEEIERKKTHKPKSIIFGILLGLGILIGVPLIAALIISFFVK
ncbi:MAG: hypothetical protein WC552_08465 [Candidatus Omnitrophota bacterium]